MKNRAKGLLALCLAMCMVLAMTTVAFGAEPYHYSQIPEDGLILQAGTQITTVKGNYSGRSFFVVDGSGNYSTTMNTENNGAHGTAYKDETNANSAVPYFTDFYLTEALESSYDTFTLPEKAGYEYNVQRVTVTEGALCSHLKDPNSDSGIPLIATALKVTPVAKGGFTVKYDLDGGKIGDKTSIDDKTDVKWTDTILTPVGTPTKDGSTFKGWKCQENTTAIIGDTTTYGDLAVTELSSITLVAQWMPAEQLPSTPSTPNETPNAPSGGDTIHRQNVTADTKADTTKTDTIASPKTFDAGVAVYAGLSLLSAAGTAIVIGRKKEF